MSRLLSAAPLATLFLAGTALADVPHVAVDIAPVHSLVSRVMQEVGTPDLIVPPGASPHEYTLRPSDARALQEADLVFWMGEDLTPWLAGALTTLAGDAAVTALLEADETTLLEFREGALFEAHHHGEDTHGATDGHDGAEEEDHADGHDHDDDHHHDHHGHDPHAWLSPANAAAWLSLIAAQLSAADPEHGAAYAANAADARAELAGLAEEVNALLDPVRGGRFIVFHDAYQYFETAFDMPAAGAISLSDATAPSPARIAEIQARVSELGIDCVLSEPQFSQGLIATVLDGTSAATAVIDPLGSDLEPGPGLYPEMMRNLASALADCLS